MYLIFLYFPNFKLKLIFSSSSFSSSLSLLLSSCDELASALGYELLGWELLNTFNWDDSCVDFWVDCDLKDSHKARLLRHSIPSFHPLCQFLGLHHSNYSNYLELIELFHCIHDFLLYLSFQFQCYCHLFQIFLLHNELLVLVKNFMKNFVN